MKNCASEPILSQEGIPERILGWYYGTKCEKCCGRFPKLMISDDFSGLSWYECEICGKKTDRQKMPWIAEKQWNEHKFNDRQMSLFEFEEKHDGNNDNK